MKQAILTLNKTGNDSALIHDYYTIKVNGVDTCQTLWVNSSVEGVYLEKMTNEWRHVVKSLSRKRKPFNIIQDIKEIEHKVKISITPFYGANGYVEYRFYINNIAVDNMQFQGVDLTNFKGGEALEWFSPKTLQIMGIDILEKLIIADKSNSLTLEVFEEITKPFIVNSRK